MQGTYQNYRFFYKKQYLCIVSKRPENLVWDARVDVQGDRKTYGPFRELTADYHEARSLFV